MRAARRLLIVLLVLFGLFVAADRIALHFAESEAATKMQTSRNLPEKPKVSIEGFPFLTQLLSSKFDEVKVTSPELTVNDGKGGPNLRLQNFAIDGKDVRVTGNYTGIVAGSGTGSALISYSDLTNALPNHTVVAYGGAPGKVKVSGKVDLPVLGAQNVSGRADVSVVDGTEISLNNLSGITGVAPGVGDLVASFLQPKLQIAGLPAGLKLNSVQAGPDGVTVQVSGTDVSLSNSN
ncbi:LmeA family phospholipid-binding protein [Streptacidiphilus sp. PAMC 29251]